MIFIVEIVPKINRKRKRKEFDLLLKIVIFIIDSEIYLSNILIQQPD